MWTITTRGFYSAVQHRDDPTRLLIRARCEEDIRALKDLLPDASPFALRRSDYEWRLECSAVEWGVALAQMALEVDYDNFKNAVKREQGQERASIYMRCWSALLGIERKGRYAAKWKPWKSKGTQPTLPRLSTQLCDCWYDEDAGVVDDHDIDCPYSLELIASDDAADIFDGRATGFGVGR